MIAWENDDEGYDEWVNDLLDKAPESYDDDASAESIVTDYVHNLEGLTKFLLDLAVVTVTDEAVRVFVGREWADVPAELWKLVTAHDEAARVG